MTEKYDDDYRKEMIAYRIQRSDEAFEEADYMARGGYYNSAVSKLYYACFYICSALMLMEGIDVNTHRGMHNQLGLRFISKGKLPARIGGYYGRLFQSRQSGDYDDFVYTDANTFDDYRQMAEEFISAVKELIAEK